MLCPCGCTFVFCRDRSLLVESFLYFYTWCMPEAKALVWMLAWAYSSEPSLLANVISSNISCVGATICIKYKTLTFHCCDSISTLNYPSINCCATLDKFA